MRRCEPAWLNIACIAPSYQVRHRLSAYTLFDVDILAFPQMNTMNERSHQELMQAKLDLFFAAFYAFNRKCDVPYLYKVCFL